MLSEIEKKDLIEKCKFNLHLKDKTILSENQLKELLLNNNFDCDIGSVEIYEKWFLTDDVSNSYVEYDNLDDLNKYRSELFNLKKEKITDKLDYSKFKGHITYYDCENCVYEFGFSICNNCNYYNDCMCELEIENFEREKNKSLSNFYDRLENEEFPL